MFLFNTCGPQPNMERSMFASCTASNSGDKAGSLNNMPTQVPPPPPQIRTGNNHKEPITVRSSEPTTARSSEPTTVRSSIGSVTRFLRASLSGRSSDGSIVGHNKKDDEATVLANKVEQIFCGIQQHGHAPSDSDAMDLLTAMKEQKTPITERMIKFMGNHFSDYKVDGKPSPESFTKYINIKPALNNPEYIMLLNRVKLAAMTLARET